MKPETEKKRYAKLSAVGKAKRDNADILTIAYAYTALHRCGLCSHMTVEGYMCYFCKGDDSE